MPAFFGACNRHLASPFLTLLPRIHFMLERAREDHQNHRVILSTESGRPLFFLLTEAYLLIHVPFVFFYHALSMVLI